MPFLVGLRDELAAEDGFLGDFVRLVAALVRGAAALERSSGAHPVVHGQAVRRVALLV